MELKRPVSRPTYTTAPPPSLYKPKPSLPKVSKKSENEFNPPVKLINSVDDAITFFSKKIGLERELLLILINSRYRVGSYKEFKEVDKLDLLAQLTQVNSVAELSKRLGEVPPINWTKKKYYQG